MRLLDKEIDAPFYNGYSAKRARKTFIMGLALRFRNELKVTCLRITSLPASLWWQAISLTKISADIPDTHHTSCWT